MNNTPHTPEQTQKIESSMSNFRRAMTGAGVGAALLLTACASDSKDCDVSSATTVDAGVVPTTDLGSPITVELTTTTEQPISTEDQEIIDRTEVIAKSYARSILDGYFAPDNEKFLGMNGNSLTAIVNEYVGADTNYVSNEIQFDPINGQIILREYATNSILNGSGDKNNEDTVSYYLIFDTDLPADTILDGMTQEEINKVIDDSVFKSSILSNIETTYDSSTSEFGDVSNEETRRYFVSSEENGLHVSYIEYNRDNLGNKSEEYRTGDMGSGGAKQFVDELAASKSRISRFTEAALAN